VQFRVMCDSPIVVLELRNPIDNAMSQGDSIAPRNMLDVGRTLTAYEIWLWTVLFVGA